jgi:tRNA (cytidine/uridine-2'-O-)-methyltransferase
MLAADCFRGTNDRAILTHVKYDPQLHIVLYQPEIPPNTGNIGRTCVAVAAKLWLVRPLGFSLEDRYLARSGLDYWEHLEWEAVDDWAALAAAVKVDPDRTWYFTKSAQRVYTDATFRPADVLVFGRETTGLPPEMIAAAGDHALRLPIRPEVRSLNLANAVAVAAYEALRQFSL